MANSIDLIVSKEAQKQLDDLYKSLTKTHEEVVAISKLQLSFNGGQSPKSVTDLNEKIKDQAKIQAQLEKQVEKNRLAEIRLQQVREKAVDKYNADLAKQEALSIKASEKIIAQKDKEFAVFKKQFEKYEADLEKQVIAEQKASQKARDLIKKKQQDEEKLNLYRRQEFDKNNQKLLEQTNKEISAYNRIQNSVNLLSKTYKDLAIRKELGNTLSASEEKNLAQITARLTQYQNALKKVDANMGNHQRNVGNYAGAFNPLSNSINQLSREMPAFANSVQTGFMAISNNLPIFFDAMGGIINQNKELQKQGLPTQSVLKQLASSVFSLGTALSIGVTLLTVYGAQIWDSISGSKARKEALEREKKAIEDKTQAEDKARERLAQAQSVEISRSQILFENAKNVTLSYSERIKAVNELQTRYPEYLSNLSKEQILAGDTADAELKLNDALVKRGIALSSQQAIQEEITNNLKNEKWLADKLFEVETKRKKLGQELQALDPFSENERVIEQYEKIKLELGRLFYLEGTLKDQYKSKNKTIQESIAFYLKQYNENAKYLDTVREETKETKKNTTAKKDKLKVDKEINRGTEEYFNSEISRLEKLRASVATTTKEYESYNAQLEFLNTSLMYLRGGERLQMAGLVTGGKSEIEQLPIATKESLEKTSQYLQSFYDQFGSESGMPTLFKVMNKEIEGFGDDWKTTAVAMMEIGQELTNTLMNQSKARFDAEYSRLEQQKNISIAFAGSSATAKAEIERQYEEKRKVIQRRQAEAEKRMAMFNIAVNTAQAIVATLGKTGFAGIPLSLIVGALGAAQLAMVAAQEIPAFAEGGVHEGGRMLINDAKGSKYQETVVTPDGKIRQFKGRNKVVDAPKGTQIFTPDQWSKQINNLLLKNNISPLQTNQTNGINKDDLESVFKKYSSSNEVAIDINENGFKKMISSNGRTREILNSRLTTKGRIV